MELALLANIEANIMSVENLVVLVVLLAGVILFARDYKIGLVSNFVAFSSLFIIFYQYNLNYITPLIISLIYFVLMALSMYMVNKASVKGGFVP